jgi:YggT family protein
MGSSYLASPLLLIIDTLFDLYVLLVLLRFLLQALRASFYNPVSQFIVRATTPPLRPLRRIIPGLGGQDMAAIVLSVILLILKYLLLRAIGQDVLGIANVAVPIGSISAIGLLLVALADIVATFINIFLFAIIIQVILSWVNPGSYNPATDLIITIGRPVMRPIQRFIPPMGGLDLSPLFASLGLMVAKMLVIPPIIYLAIQL